MTGHWLTTNVKFISTALLLGPALLDGPTAVVDAASTGAGAATAGALRAATAAAAGFLAAARAAVTGEEAPWLDTCAATLSAWSTSICSIDVSSKMPLEPGRI